MKIAATFRDFAWKVFPIAALLLVGACASAPMSPDTMRSIDKSVNLGIVRIDPQAHREKVILTGGEVVSVKNTSDGGEIEVLEYPLDSSGRPTEAGDSAGRFLARSRSLLDPEVYRKGRLVTIAGAVTGTESRTIDKATYPYVVLAIREIHAWRPQEATPYRYPGPAYYYDPYFYDPYYFSPYYTGPYILHPRTDRGYEGGRHYEGSKDVQRDRNFERSRERGQRDTNFERSRGIERNRGFEGGRGFERGRGHGGGGHWGGGGNRGGGSGRGGHGGGRGGRH